MFVTVRATALLLAGAGAMVGAAVPAAAQTCRDDSEGTADFVWAQNENAGVFNFSYWADTPSGAPVRKVIRMADPTIIKIKDRTNQTWFFVTGTTDGIGLPVAGTARTWREVSTNNFPIFRSTNLRDWYLHSFVFAQDLQGATGTTEERLLRVPHPNGHRYFKHLWSPQLYYDPNEGDGQIYITFAAAEIKDNDLDDDGLPDEDIPWNGVSNPIDPDTNFDLLTTQQISCMVAWTDKTRFLTQDLPWITSTHNNWMPSLYCYRVNNSGSALYLDGGAAQTAATGLFSSIPTTGNTHPAFRYNPLSPLCGMAVKVTFGFHWSCEGPRTWMGDAPLVFFDPNNGCKPWLTWTWVQRGGLPVDQNNIAAFPFAPGPHSSTYYLMDAQYANPHFGGLTQPLQLFTSYNTTPANMVGGIPNGRIAADASNNPVQWVPADTGTPAGVAEGSDVFFYNNRYYALATRNPVSSPAYQIVYRRTEPGQPLTSLHLSPWDVFNPPVSVHEDVLVASDWVRDLMGNRHNSVRTNYGHPQFFTAYGRPYIIFHKMLDTLTGERRIFIKELNFNQTTGEIARIWESYPYPDLHVQWFKAPNVPNVSTPPVP